MQKLFKFLLVLTITSLAVGCAAPAIPATPTTAPSMAAPTAEAAAFPVTIAHKYGSTTIEKLPQRIVLVGLTEQDALLALGVVPVATREWYGGHPGAIFPWAQDKLGNAPVPVVLSTSELNFEQIATLKPDVIVGLYAGLTQEEYDTLSKIAPTVAQPAEYVDYGIPWQELTKTIGLIVGKKAEAEKLVADVEAKFAEARTEHPEFQNATGVVASAWGYPDTYYAYNSQDARGRFITSLGFKTIAEVDKLAGTEYGASISRERLNLVDVDALVWIDLDRASAEADPLYQQTRAFREKRDVFLPGTDPIYDALNFSTVLSLPFAIDGLLPRLAAAVDGDPTTNVVDTEAKPAFPVTIEHKYGSTTLDKLPERIVLVGLTEQDTLLALGVVPMATREWYGGLPGAIFPWAKDKLGNAAVPVVLSSTEINFEQIASLKPDVIIGLYSALTEDEYKTLSKIAPTVAQPGNYVDYGIPWQELTQTVGLIVGKEPEAKALVASVENRFKEVKAQHPEFTGKSGVVASTWGFPDTYYVYHSQDPRNRFMTELGFTIPAEVDTLAKDTFGATVSRERLDLVDVDAVVWITFSTDDVEKVKTDPLYKQLKAASEGRDIFLTPDNPLYDALNFNTVLSLPFAIDGMLPELTAAVDGDPTTTAAAAGFPVTLEHKFGTITIPAEPKRVITLGYSEQDPVLALGIVPVAVRDWFGDQPSAVWPWAQGKLGGAKPEVLKMPFGELNFETIAALKPDLIVATHSGITEDEYKTLSQIAPTLAQPAEYVDFGMPWQEQTRFIGKALGRSAQAEALIKDVEGKITAAATAHPEFAKATVSWAIPTGEAGEYWVVGPNTPPLRFLSALGFQYPAETAKLVGDLDSAKLSSERIDLLDVDVLLLKTASPEEKSAVEANALFKQLAVAKENRTIFFVGDTDPIYGALSFSTILSLPYALDGLVPQLSEALAAQ